MISVGLTGNIAAGKSAVADLFRSWGATVIDADQLVRELQEPGSPVLAAMIERFGPRILRPDGTLDRPALRAHVLEHPGARADLERIVHPAVEARRRALVETARRRGDRVVVSDIPLLFESGDPSLFDAVVLVDAPAGVRLERLVQLRGLDRDTAAALIEAQMPAEEKRARSDYVIENAGDLGDLERATRSVWRRLTSPA